MYESRKNIARYFQVQGKHDLAISYYREALDQARNVEEDPSIEIEATRNIGMELESHGSPEEASEMYEESRQLARASNNADAEQLAAKSLVSVHMKLAKQQEKAKHYEAAIEEYTHCVQILQESCPDEQTLNDLNYRLGRAHQQTGNIATAIEFLETFLLKVRKYGDRVKEGWAQAVLASCHESAGNLAQASESLTRFLAITESDPTQTHAQAQACNHLGNLYNRMGEFDLAVGYFERHYQLACGGGTVVSASNTTASPPAVLSPSIKTLDAGGSDEITPVTSDTGTESPTTAVSAASPVAAVTPTPPKSSDVGIAQVQLGISRANAHMDRFLDMVKDEKKLSRLLEWKATHSFSVFQEEERVAV
ncbi:Tetratricopeptide repeat protein 29 [Thoreauomyces humboldtii]|nr:Tetratricopeptide repeat protein 29 [Thoreauomyces humboldtii]